MKKKILVIGLAMTLVCSLAGCGKENSTEATSEAEGTTAESVSSEETEVTTEEVVEENPTWFSENNITFTEGEVTAPVYAYARNEDGTVDESVEMTQMDGSYSEPVIEVSEPDENNNVTYTVTYDISTQWIGTMSMERAQNGKLNAIILYETYNFIDAYTGTVFPTSNLTEDNEHAYFIESDVEVNGKTYNISTNCSAKNEWEEGNWTDLDSKAKYKNTCTFHVTLTAIVPEEYDGLIIALDGTGSTEYHELDTEVEEAYPFEDDVETTIFKDVTYGTALEEKLGDKYWYYRDDLQNDSISQIYVFYGGVQVQFDSVIDEDETKADGFVTVNWKDGTCTKSSYENIMYDVLSADEYTDHDTLCITVTLDSYFDATQVESVIIGDKEYSDGEIKEGW